MDQTPTRGDLPERQPSRIDRIRDLKRDLANYFAAIGAAEGHVFTLRDINLQVMNNVFAAQERELLGPALADLVAEGCLLPVLPAGYRLTADGVRRVRDVRTTLRGPVPTGDVALAPAFEGLSANPGA